MKSIFCAFVVVLAICDVYGQGQQKIVMEKIDIIMTDNGFFNDWVVDLHESGEKLSLKMPVKADLPDNMMMKIVSKLGNDDLPEMEMTLCEAFDDDKLAKDIIDHGFPVDTYPRECPIVADGSLEVRDYEFPHEKLPPSTQDGPLSSIVTIYEEGKEPYITIISTGEIIHR